MTPDQMKELAARLRKIKQLTTETCPNCFDAEFRGYKRGFRCEVCNGSGEVENKTFDPDSVTQAADLIEGMAQRVPLTNEQIREIVGTTVAGVTVGEAAVFRAVARAVEQAHGIGGES